MALTKILTSGLIDSAATAAKVAAGAVVQVVQLLNTTSGVTLATGMSVTALPVITDGTQILSQTFTLKSASNKVLVIAILNGSPGANNYAVLSVWRGSSYVTGAVVAMTANYPSPVLAIQLDSPATDAEVTYSVRGGSNSSGIVLNGYSGPTRISSMVSSITLMEIKA